jgi:hypothetical protein
MMTGVMTSGNIGILSDTDASAVVSFNDQVWYPTDDTFTVTGQTVMTKPEVHSSLTTCQTNLPITTNNTHNGTCEYSSGSISASTSPVLTKGGREVFLQTDFEFDCEITIQPVDTSKSPPVSDSDYPIGTLVPCQYTIATGQSILRAEDS